MVSKSLLLSESICAGPLLIGALEEASVFNRAALAKASEVSEVRFDQKLGHLYEQVLASMIRVSPDWKLLARNLQVFEADGRTIGELDFVLQELASGRYIHLELAVKFYLAVPESDGWRFQGPDPSDSWSRKLSHMRKHQLQLCQRGETKRLLQDQFGIKVIVAEQLIYGILFEPMGHLEKVDLPEIARGARRGRWLLVREWDKYFPRVGKAERIPKALWPVVPSEDARQFYDLVGVDELKEMASERCTLFAFPECNEVFFLVPDDWLDVASAFATTFD